ncbi:hypothetical protein [Nocardia sp. CA-290969]|uniref:hypothetical protein n=1 Tax=Nocardia sp. CA-290969 TaxID=3239986 RepID=UPI003D945354
MTAPHRHRFDVLEFDIDPERRHIDHTVIAECLGAGLDGCPVCGQQALEALITNAAATARLVEIACVAIGEMFGGIPAYLYDDNVGGPASATFRRLARLGVDGKIDQMFSTVEDMTLDERRQAADTAMDITIGRLVLAGLGMR